MTKAVVGYMQDNQFRGTYVHFDGDIAGNLLATHIHDDQDALVAWIENGIAKGGYYSAEANTRTFNAEENLFDDIIETMQVVPHIWLAEDGVAKDIWASMNN